MTTHNLRILTVSSYRDVYSYRNDATNSSFSATRNNTTAASSHINDPYARNFTDTGTKDVTTLVLFVLLLTFSTCLVLMRLSQYCDGQDEQRRERQHNHQQQPSNEIRTQETIEKMIVLKKVLTATVRDLDLSRSRKGKRRIERRKSNLLLRSNKTDELDESRTCPICLCEYEHGESICWSHNKQCAHHFHAQCGIAWLAKHTECPICRANYLVQPSEDQKNGDHLPLSEEPQQNNVITIIEQGEDPPENNDEEEYQQSLEMMEEGSTNVSASQTENTNDTTVPKEDKESYGVCTTDPVTQQVSSSIVSGTDFERNDELMNDDHHHHSQEHGTSQKT